MVLVDGKLICDWQVYGLYAAGKICVGGGGGGGESRRREREISRRGVGERVNQGTHATELFLFSLGRKPNSNNITVHWCIRRTPPPPNLDFQTCQYALKLFTYIIFL